MHRGYIKLWRKAHDAGWLKNPELWTFWTWCLLSASHKKCKLMVGFQEVELLPGQFVFGRRKAATALRLSERKIRTCLNTLKTTNNLTIKTTSKFSIITIVNWDTYQPEENKNDQQPDHQNDQRPTSKRPASDQQVTTNKNDKNVKNDKNNNARNEKHLKTTPPRLEDVVAYFTEKGFTEDAARKAFDYYSEGEWKDSKGNPVKNWKQKMIAVWFKDENRINPRRDESWRISNLFANK